MNPRLLFVPGDAASATFDFTTYGLGLFDTQFRIATRPGLAPLRIFEQRFTKQLDHARTGIVAIACAAAHPTRVHDQVTITGQANPKPFKQTCTLTRSRHGASWHVPAEANPCIALVDVLTTGTTRTTRGLFDFVRGY